MKEKETFLLYFRLRNLFSVIWSQNYPTYFNNWMTCQHNNVYQSTILYGSPEDWQRSISTRCFVWTQCATSLAHRQRDVHNPDAARSHSGYPSAGVRMTLTIRMSATLSRILSLVPASFAQTAGILLINSRLVTLSRILSLVPTLSAGKAGGGR